MTPLKNTMFAVSERAGRTKRRLCTISLFLILISCTDNNKSSQSTESVEEIIEPPAPELVIASYDIKPELFWLDEFGITCEPLAEDIGYSAIYYEPISNKYYRTEINYIYPLGRPVTYDTNNIQDEKNYYEFEKKSFPKLPLRYVGSTDLTNRIYIDTNNNIYVKQLKLLEDNEYYIFTNSYPLKEPVYPYVDYSDVSGYRTHKMIYYSNSIQIFYRVFPIGRLSLFEETKSE